MSAVAVVISVTLFFLAGLAFGYALGPPLMWIPLAFPLIMALGGLLTDGPSLSILIRLVVALAVTLLGIFLGQRLAPEQRPKRPRANMTAAPRAWCNGCTRAFQALSTGSTPVARSAANTGRGAVW